jgi:hypothetical protein
MDMRNHLRTSVLSSGLSLVLVSLLFANSQLTFSQEPGELKQLGDGDAWVIEMERRVWLALGTVDMLVNVVHSVECTYPTCQIVYDSSDSSRARIGARIDELLQNIGKDHLGRPLAKQRSIVRRELSPGYETVFITINTRHPQVEAQMQMLEACRRAKEANVPTPLGITCDL